MNPFVLKAWLVAKLAQDERGASFLEYALLASLIAVVCLLAVMTIGGTLNSKYNASAGSVPA